MKKFLTALIILLSSLQTSAQLVPPCEQHCEITWEQVFNFKTVSKIYDVSVYQPASEIFVQSVNGTGTIRELILYMNNGQKRYLTDTYKQFVAGEQGVVVRLGNFSRGIHFVRIRAESSGGAGTEASLIVQLRERFQPPVLPPGGPGGFPGGGF